MTNGEVALRLGIHMTMASRLRNGLRLPSVSLLHKIHQEFGIPHEDLVQAHEAGREEFGKLLRERVFNAENLVAAIP